MLVIGIIAGVAALCIAGAVAAILLYMYDVKGIKPPVKSGSKTSGSAFSSLPLSTNNNFSGTLGGTLAGTQQIAVSQNVLLSGVYTVTVPTFSATAAGNGTTITIAGFPTVFGTSANVNVTGITVTVAGTPVANCTAVLNTTTKVLTITLAGAATIAATDAVSVTTFSFTVTV
jgi:hypothetical protein